MTKELRTPTKDAYKQMYVGNGYYTTCQMGEDDYIAISQIWKRLREQRLKADHFQCRECGKAINLQVHHIRYPKAWGTEDINDLVTLCDNCHSIIHKKEDK